MMRSAIPFSLSNKQIKRGRVSGQARWIQLYPTAAKAMTTTTTSHSTDANSEIRPVVMFLTLAAATTAWLSGGPEHLTQIEPALSSPNVLDGSPREDRSRQVRLLGRGEELRRKLFQF
jgi:hypothetical protein